MSDKTFPRINNYYFTPGQKVAIHVTQPKGVFGLLTRRGPSKLCFKLTTEFCKKNLPDAYNNSMLDIDLVAGTATIYPKAMARTDVFEAVAEITRVALASGAIDNSNFNPYIDENTDVETELLKKFGLT